MLELLYNLNWIKVAVLFDVLLMVLFFATAGVLQIARHTWAWVDDSKPTEYAWFSYGIAKLLGYKHDYSNSYRNPNGTLDKGDELCLLAWIVSCVGSLLVGFALEFPWAGGTVLAALVLIYLSRYVRRLHKKINAHVEDKEVHK